MRLAILLTNTLPFTLRGLSFSSSTSKLITSPLLLCKYSPATWPPAHCHATVNHSHRLDKRSATAPRVCHTSLQSSTPLCTSTSSCRLCACLCEFAYHTLVQARERTVRDVHSFEAVGGLSIMSGGCLTVFWR